MPEQIINKIQLPNNEIYDIQDATAKRIQTAVANPTASGFATAFIDSISQNEQGVITVTKKNIQASVTGVKGDIETTYRTGEINLTPAHIGAVAKTGDTMTGNLSIKKGTPGIFLFGASDSVYAASVYEIVDSGSNNRLAFAIRKDGSVGQEVYFLPVPDEHSAQTNYGILTTKSPVTIGQGGTGATTSAAARTNLGITPINIGAVANTGDSMTGNLNMKNGTSVTFTPSSRTNRVGHIYGTVSSSDLGRIGIAVYAYDNTTYPDYFLLPNPTHRTESGNNIFELLSTKNAVTVAQGGTGATIPSEARNNLHAAFATYIEASDWSTIWGSFLSNIRAMGGGAFFVLSAGAASTLSNRKLSSSVSCFVTRSGDTGSTFRIVSVGLGQYLYVWQISNASADQSTATFGTVYRYTGSTF